MALHQFVRCFTAVVILLSKGCHSQQPACGRAAINTRIYGGEDASPGSWPWHAFIVTYGPHGFTQCGGSLITNQWVLTAAQCIPSSRYRTEVYLGRYSQSGLNPNEVTQKVEGVFCHPAHTDWLNGNDICLLKLSAPVNFTDYIQPICLASGNSTFYSGTSSWVTGFGSTGYYGNANILQEANVQILGNNGCSCHYLYFKITENITCTGPKDGWMGPCNGDQGEPLMTKTGSVWVQSGIASYSSCGGPSVYTLVSKYQKWISNTVTGIPPGFVTFTSPGTDSDLNFTCPRSSPTNPPTTVPTTVGNTAVPTVGNTAVPTTVGNTAVPTTVGNATVGNATVGNTTVPTIFGNTTVGNTTVPTIFGNTTVLTILGNTTVGNTTIPATTVHSGENLIHFNHFTSLCVFVLLIHIFNGNGM